MNIIYRWSGIQALLPRCTLCGAPAQIAEEAREWAGQTHPSLRGAVCLACAVELALDVTDLPSCLGQESPPGPAARCRKCGHSSGYTLLPFGQECRCCGDYRRDGAVIKATLAHAGIRDTSGRHFQPHGDAEIGGDFFALAMRLFTRGS